jgi:hypothetical protein
MPNSANTSVLKTIWALLFSVIFIASGCKKEVVSSPEVQFVQPFANQSYDFGDTIWVEAEVSHPDLQAINLSLVNDQFNRVEPSVPINAGSNRVVFTAYIVITNKNLTSGKHYVEIEVRAGGELFNFQRPVNVFELPKQRLALYVVSTPNGPGSRWLMKFENNAMTLGATYGGDVSGLAVNSFDGSLFMAPQYNGPLLEFSTVSDSVIFEEENTASGGAPFMTGIRNTDNHVYAFYGNGEVVQYGAVGRVIRVMQLPNTFRADDALFVNNTLVVHASDGMQSKLFFYPASGTNLIRQIDVPQNEEHIRLEPYAMGEFLMLYNTNGQAGWNRYATNGQEVNMPALPGFTLNDAVSVSSSSVVLATNQGIKRYINTQASLADLSADIAQHMEWDEANERVVYTSGSGVRACTLPAFTQVESYVVPPSVQDIVLLYNK